MVQRKAYVKRYRIGNVSAGGFDLMWLPRRIRGSTKCGVILNHGASSSSSFSWDSPSWDSQHKLAAVLASEGIPVVTAYEGGNNWANDAMSGTSGAGYINTKLSYLSTTSGCRSDKVIVGGLSMGGAATARWASLNQSKAAAVFGLLPAVSMEHLYNDNPAGTVAGNTSAAYNIGNGLGLSPLPRVVTDAVTNGTTTLTSATAAFTGADVGRQIVRPYTETNIPVNTKIVSVTNATTVVLDKVAASGTGRSIAIAVPLPMTGTAGWDLIGVHAPRIAAASIPNRWYGAADDTLVYPADVAAFATAAGGTSYTTFTGGHANAAVAQMESHNGGSDWSDLVNWIKACGA